ncbi:RHS repeat-associated core domain-containing protein, partial [Massilia scottii]|uniref:RHS repeat-associated core domain-containing protein n=1 Tax=Massilia scottii TaxID=3057166 RepID=UPI002796AE8A
LSNKLSATTGPGPAKTTIVYNGAGDLTTDGTHVVTYSGRGRPYRNQNGAVTTHQLFNGLDQRVFQTYGGGIFVYDEQGQLVGEYSYLNGKATRDTVYLGNLPVAVLTQTVTGTAPAQSTAINVFHIHPDHLGTPRMITRQLDNKIVWRWDNGDPFGLTPPTEYFNGSGTFTFNLRMPGQYYDRSTNLFHNYHRDYDPQSGRYIQSDPVGLVAGINTYIYALGRPASHTDRLGLATDGEPLNKDNCAALARLIQYENENGKTLTIMKYNSLNFSDDMINLDAAFPSNGGEVSIDWMMRSGGGGSTSLPGVSYIMYGIGKSWWNISQGTKPSTNLAGTANSNGPAALSAWMYGDVGTLGEMFEKSTAACGCLKK